MPQAYRRTPVRNGARRHQLLDRAALPSRHARSERFSSIAAQHRLLRRTPSTELTLRKSRVTADGAPDSAAARPSVERDLLISKLFPLGKNANGARGSVSSATVAILGSIVRVVSDRAQTSVEETTPAPVEKLPAESMVVCPTANVCRLANRGVMSFGHLTPSP